MAKFYCEFLGKFHDIASETTHQVNAISRESKLILFSSRDQDVHFLDIVCFVIRTTLRSPQLRETF